MNFSEELIGKQKKFQLVLEKYLPKEGTAGSAAAAVNYSMRAPGKRLRPVFLMECCRLFGGTEEEAEPFAVALEMIHTHSLIHDDLPAIDNDDYRRGRLTTHKKYGEAIGLLSGDVLLNYAYETMLHGLGKSEHRDRAIRAMTILAEKSGISGMLGGQCVDVENDGKPLDQKTLEYIYKNKTAALIEGAMMAGAALAGAEEEQIAQMERAGQAIGLAFQIRDDILDVVSTTDELGKPVHSDEKNKKVTYVTLFGVEEAEKEVLKLSKEAEQILAEYEESAFLSALTESLIYRKK